MKPIRVLIIEDNQDDVILEVNELISGGFDIVYEQIETKEDLIKALIEKPWDCIISDYSMPNFSGLDALMELKKTNKDIPFILISGTIGEETAVEAMKAGAHDYIMKNNLKRLIPAFERELRDAEVRSQKRQTEEDIRNERILLRTLIDNLPDLIYVKDKDCRKIVSNIADTEFMGYTSEKEIIGKTDLEIFPGEVGKRGYLDDLSIIQTGMTVLNREEEFSDAKGKQHWLLTSKIPLYNEQGQISGLVGMGHNITDLKQIEFALKESEQNLKNQNIEYQNLNKEYLALNKELTESLNRIQSMNSELIISKDKAEESDRLKSAFMANMSHEIRTPLNAILGFSGFFRDPDLSREKVEKYVEIIESSGQQLITIINDILDISKIEAGQITISSDKVNINKLLDELFLQFKKQVELKDLELFLNSDSQNKNIVTQTDENRLRQILCNLLNNAIKFTSKGKVEFGFNLLDGFISFFIRDTGIGIAPENHLNIFEPFRQVENTFTRKYGGNGLGLSISKALVEKLGGAITLNSEPNKGSTFSFTIPYIKNTVTTNKSELSTTPVTRKNWHNHIMLVVEDELHNYFFIEEILSPTKIKVLHAWNGKEAIELVKKHPDISLVLMDIKMPVMDGYTATRLIKELRPQLPVVAQTAYTLGEEREKDIEAGFDNFISKPIKNEFLMEVIGNYL